jgi:predicted methyltransferase
MLFPSRFRAGLLLAVMSVGVMPAFGQTAPPTHAQSEPRATSRPYTGDLSIFDYPDRDKKLQIDRVMDLLGITPGKNVGDLGAGSGWFTVIASKRVGATGVVIAEDINPVAIEYIGKRIKKDSIENVRTVLGTPDDPGFPPGSLDAVLMLKVYHEIAHPVTAMRKLKPSLRPGAKVGIIDKNGNGADHGVKQDVVVKEMGEAGYSLVGTYDFTKTDGEDYFLIFTLRK